jgi:hypothetical protein
MFPRGDLFFAFRRVLGLDALEVVVYRNGERFFGVFLPDAVEIQLAFYFRGFGHGKFGLFLLVLQLQFTVEDVLAKDDAIITDIDAGAGDEFAHFRVRLTAETAHRDIVWPGHVIKIYASIGKKPIACCDLDTTPQRRLFQWKEDFSSFARPTKTFTPHLATAKK